MRGDDRETCKVKTRNLGSVGCVACDRLPATFGAGVHTYDDRSMIKRRVVGIV